jgi:threonine dehydrogenase-like Zn-dependent dehydrogenase
VRAAVMYGAGDVCVEDRPDPKIRQPTDAVVRALRAAICGSDLHPYHSMPPTDQGRPMATSSSGSSRRSARRCPGLKAGDLMITPFTWADNTCDFCRKGLHTSCRHGGRYGFDGVDGGQGQAVRVPQAQGTLVKLPVAEDSPLLASLLTLSDVLCTGHHGASKAPWARDAAPQPHPHRWRRPGPGLHRGTDARHPGWHHRARPRL